MESEIAPVYGAERGAGIPFSSFFASLEGRAEMTFIWHLRKRLRFVKPLPEVTGPGGGRGGI